MPPHAHPPLPAERTNETQRLVASGVEASGRPSCLSGPGTHVRRTSCSLSGEGQRRVSWDHALKATLRGKLYLFSQANAPQKHVLAGGEQLGEQLGGQRMKRVRWRMIAAATALNPEGHRSIVSTEKHEAREESASAADSANQERKRSFKVQS